MKTNYFYIGIDLGGTNVRIIAVEERTKRILAYRKETFQKADSGEKELSINIFRLVDEVCDVCKTKETVIGGIGMALAASFNRKTGVITKWSNNPKWNGIHLREALEKRYQIPVVLEDDANAAALGELIAGKGIGYHDFVYVTISTGIGCGIVINDKLLTGKCGGAGELGHIKVTEDKILCNCGAYGCLQAIASGPAILKRFFGLTKQSSQNFELQQVVEYAKSGDLAAIEAFRIAGEHIGRAIANVAILLDISLFILGGGVMRAGSFIMYPIEEAISDSLQDKKKIKLIVSEDSDRSGVFGALALLHQHVSLNKNDLQGREAR